MPLRNVQSVALFNNENKTITIRRTVQYLPRNIPVHDGVKFLHETKKGYIIEKSPKNETSERILYIDEGEIGLLSAYRNWWLQQRLLNGDQWTDTDKLFIKENGGVMHPDSVTDFTKKLLKKYNLPHFSPHSLRHTNISLMIAACVDLKTAASRAGHANINMISAVYAHQIQSANAKAAEKLNCILNIKKGVTRA